MWTCKPASRKQEAGNKKQEAGSRKKEAKSKQKKSSRQGCKWTSVKLPSPYHVRTNYFWTCEPASRKREAGREEGSRKQQEAGSSGKQEAASSSIAGLGVRVLHALTKLKKNVVRAEILPPPKSKKSVTLWFEILLGFGVYDCFQLFNLWFALFNLLNMHLFAVLYVTYYAQVISCPAVFTHINVAIPHFCTNLFLRAAFLVEK
jgi:hypothetical protein